MSKKTKIIPILLLSLASFVSCKESELIDNIEVPSIYAGGGDIRVIGADFIFRLIHQSQVLSTTITRTMLQKRSKILRLHSRVTLSFIMLFPIDIIPTTTMMKTLL